MSSFKGLLWLCLAGLSLAEPPVAPYPPAGPPSGSSFPPNIGGTSQFQGLPEVLDSRSNNFNDQANHRIHFNLFKDHETKKSKENISFKLNQGDGPFRSGTNRNFENNFKDTEGNNYNDGQRNFPPSKFGSPHSNRNFGGTDANFQSLDGRQQGKNIDSKYAYSSQSNGPQTKYGPPQNSFDYRQRSPDYQTDYTSSSRAQNIARGYQSQPPSGESREYNRNLNNVRLSDKSQSFDQVGRSLYQQPSSSAGSSRVSPQNSSPPPVYGVPFQGQGFNHFRKMEQYQQRSQNFNPAEKYSDVYRQGSSSQFNEERNLDQDKTEKANYEFEYEVRGEQSHGHEESREGDEAWGSYRVQLPDGRTMLVEYTADDRGYRPKITYSDQQFDQQAY